MKNLDISDEETAEKDIESRAAHPFGGDLSFIGYIVILTSEG